MPARKRELIQPDAGDKRYVRRDDRAGRGGCSPFSVRSVDHMLQYGNDCFHAPAYHPGMALPKSKVTTTGRVTIPAEIRRKLGVGPGSILEWVEDGEVVIVRKARYSFEDIHRAVFMKPPEPRTLEQLKQSIVDYIRDKHSRD